MILSLAFRVELERGRHLKTTLDEVGLLTEDSWNQSAVPTMRSRKER